MKIEDCVPETLNCQISLAITEKQNQRMEKIVEAFKKLPKKPNPRNGLRIKFDEFLDEAEALLKEYNSKNLDLSVLK